MRLIDADDLADALFEKQMNYPQWVADVIGNMPDAVVLCKDCRHGEIDTEHFVRPVIVCNNPLNGVAHVSHRFEWFCADGVMRE